MQQDKDRAAQWWLFAHFGKAMLKLAGVEHVATCTAVKDALVAPRRYPDGLLEVTYDGRPTKGLYLVEIESYADADADRQMFENLMLVAADRRRMPEAIMLVLWPKGNARVAGRYEMTSLERGTTITASWRFVEVWTLNATNLLAENDVGLVPWVPLTRFDVPAEDLLRECRARIDRDAPPVRRPALLGVAQILAGFALLDRRLMDILGGPSMLLESPYLQEVTKLLEERLKKQLAAELTEQVSREVTEQVGRKTKHDERVQAIMDVLTARFRTIPADLAPLIVAVTDVSRLADLHRWAVVCPDLAAFRSRLD